MRALLLALALLVPAAPAHAGTMLLAPVVQGAGTVFTSDVEYSCTKTNGFNDDASTKCPAQLVDSTSVWLKAAPAPNTDFAFTGWQGCDETRASGTECRVTPPASGPQVERNPVALFNDTLAPTATLDAGPTDSATVKPTFSSPDTTATFRCRLDQGEFAPCTSGTEYTVADGPHTFGVVAVDPSSNVGPERTAAWETDVNPPTLTLEGGPPAFTSSRNATFTVVASPDTKLVTCLLNGAPCSLPIQLSSLADNLYTLIVSASDGRRSVSVTRVWDIDTVAPDTTLSPDLKLTSNEPGVTFECSLDGKPYSSCTFPDGTHTVAARARDKAGNVDPTPATRTYAPALDISIPYFVKASRTQTRFAELAVKNVPEGATVKVSCKGKGCPRKTQTLRVNKQGTVQLKAWRGKPFKTGAKLTITVTVPGAEGVAKTFTFRAAKRPRITTKTIPLAS